GSPAGLLPARRAVQERPRDPCRASEVPDDPLAPITHGVMRLVVPLLLLALAAPVAAEAQPHGKVVRIGLLDLAVSDPGSIARWQAFRDGLRDAGYVEGQNVVYELRHADGQVSRLPKLAAELVQSHVDVLVTASSEAAVAAKRATATIPIVTATG